MCTPLIDWKRLPVIALALAVLIAPSVATAESLKDGVILRDNAEVILKDGSVVECHRIVWLVLAADYVQCDQWDRASEIKLDDLDFEKTFGPDLAREYAAMKDDLSDAHAKSRKKQEASRITYPAPSMDRAEDRSGADKPSAPRTAAGGGAGKSDVTENLDDLLKTLAESESAVKAYNAAKSIGSKAAAREDCSRAIAPLIKQLDDERPVLVILSRAQLHEPVADAVKRALVSIGSPAVPALLDLVKGSRPDARKSAVNRAVIALGEIGDPRAVRALTLHAQGPGKLDSRRSAVRALANIKTPDAWNELIGVMRTQEGTLRQDAAWGLHRMNGSRAGAVIDPYMNAILAKAEGSDLANAVSLAGACGFKRLAPDFVRYLGHADFGVVFNALGALVAVGAPADALPRLMELAADKRHNDRATRAISTINDPAAIRGLINGLSHSDAKARQASARALGEIGRGEAVPALARALSDQDRETRFAALQALGKIPGADATQVIRGYAESGDPRERQWAEGLLRSRKSGAPVADGPLFR